MKLKLQIATVCNCDTQVKLRKIFIAITAPCNCDRKSNCDCLQLRRGIKLPLATAIVCLQLKAMLQMKSKDQFKRAMLLKFLIFAIATNCDCLQLRYSK